MELPAGISDGGTLGQAVPGWRLWEDRGPLTLSRQHPTCQPLTSSTFTVKSRESSFCWDLWVCLCFVLKFTVNIFIKRSARLSIVSRHLAVLRAGSGSA